jgi:hypothetical protein
LVRVAGGVQFNSAFTRKLSLGHEHQLFGVVEAGGSRLTAAQSGHGSPPQGLEDIPLGKVQVERLNEVEALQAVAVSERLGSRRTSRQ